MRKTSAFASMAVIVAAVVSFAGPANAGEFYQEWGSSEDYRASHDFIPNKSSIKPVGMACGGDTATYFLMQIMKTSTQRTVHYLDTRSANDKWYDNYGNKSVQSGHAYYMRHFSYRPNGQVGQSGCQVVGATW